MNKHSEAIRQIRKLEELMYSAHITAEEFESRKAAIKAEALKN